MEQEAAVPEAPASPYMVPLPRSISRKAERSHYSKSALFSKIEDAAQLARNANESAKQVVVVAGEIAEHFKASVKALHEDRDNALKAVSKALDEAAAERVDRKSWALVAEERRQAAELWRARFVRLTVASAVQALGALAWWLLR